MRKLFVGAEAHYPWMTFGEEPNLPTETITLAPVWSHEAKLNWDAMVRVGAPQPLLIGLVDTLISSLAHRFQRSRIKLRVVRIPLVDDLLAGVDHPPGPITVLVAFPERSDVP